jgi:flagellar hook-associated protein 3 FlgL
VITSYPYSTSEGVGGTLGRLVNDSSDIKLRFDRLTEQSSSGLVSQTYGGLAGRAQLSLDLRPQIARADIFTQNITRASTQNDLSTQVLDQLQTIASSFFSGTLGMSAQTSQEIDAMAAEANAALSQVQGLINTKVGDTFLFAGQDSANPPLPDSNFQAYVQSIKLATGNLAGVGGAATAAATLAAASNTSPFSTTLGNTRQSVSVGFGISTPVGIVAGQNTFVTQIGSDTTGSYVRDLIRSLATIGSMSSGQSSSGPAFALLVDDTRASLGKQIATINNENAGLGESKVVLAMNQAVVSDTVQALTTQVSSVENVDAALTATSLNKVQTQLQISYKLISSMQGLSLVHFL